MRDKIKGGEQAIKSTLQKIDGEDEKKPLHSLMKIKKTYWFENYRWFISSNGNIIVAGKNAKTNDRLVKKHLEKDDLYVHADFHGAPSCIIKSLDVKNNKRNIDEKTIEEACIFAVIYSRAWKQGGNSNAYWVYPYQVSKTPQSGEFLPKGAFIIRGKRNYQKCKLELAIGKIYIEGQQKLMGGPVTAVKKITNHYIVFSPGNKTKEEITKYLTSFFKVSIEDIQSILPSGKITKLEESK
jgi:predicted ribosome quality control (RQC) complex YloA/Tae2 family protein